MSIGKHIEYVVRPEDFGMLEYNIPKNSIRRSTHEEFQARLANPGENTLIRGLGNPSLGTIALRAPEKIYVDILQNCNMACEHCLSDSGVFGTDIINADTMSGIGSQMVEMGIFRTKLGGGEPPIHPQFKEIVTDLRDKSLGVSMSTNGLLVATRRDLAPFLAQQGVKVSVSLDGGPEVHTHIRKHPQAYTGAISAIEKLQEAGAYVAIGMTLSRTNIGEVAHVVQVAEAHQVPVKIKRVKPYGRAIANDLLISPQTPGYNEAIKIINGSEWARPEGMLSTSPCSAEDDLFPEHNNCGAGTRSMGVDPSGKFSPCFFLGGQFLEGDVTTDRIADVWTNGRINLEMRSVAMEGVPACDASCPLSRVCHGECRAMSLHMTGDIHAVDPGCPLERN